MAVEQAWMLKGWLIAKDAPPEIMNALQAVIDGASATRVEIRQQALTIGPVTDDAFRAAANTEDRPDPVAELEVAEEAQTAKKSRKPWSDEARAAAAERMRARQAARGMTKGYPERTAAADPQKPFTPVSVEKLQHDHNAYAGKRDPDQPLLDSDWPDIKHMLNVKRMTVTQVASDYDVEFGTLRSFIDTHEAREEQLPGEARAPLMGGA